ncbi:MAG TPA: hypothetical protein VGM54_25760 [Chthoniobacter sp.]|jgi:hypothetical protein
MKYVFILATVAAIYFFIVKKPSVAPVVSAVTQAEAAPLTTGPRGGEPTPVANAPARASDYLKKPIDRTKEVLNQVKQRNGDGEF